MITRPCGLRRAGKNLAENQDGHKQHIDETKTGIIKMLIKTVIKQHSQKNLRLAHGWTTIKQDAPSRCHQWQDFKPGVTGENSSP